MPIRNVIIVYKPSRECLELMKKYAIEFRKRGVRVDTIWVDELRRGGVDGYDIVVAMGGDGTLLRISWSLYKRLPIILPIPCGRRTVLYEELDKADPGYVVDCILAGRFFIDRVERLKALINNAEYYALNEVALISHDSGRVLHLDVSIETPFNKTRFRLESDGLLIATPTGSSAYSLSARGPLIETRLNTILFIPLNSVTLNITPMVLHPFSKINVGVHDYTNAFVDGKMVSMLPPSSTVLFRLCNNFLRIARIGEKRDLVKKVLESRVTRFL